MRWYKVPTAATETVPGQGCAPQHMLLSSPHAPSPPPSIATQEAAGDTQAEIKALSSKAREDASEISRLKQALANAAERDEKNDKQLQDLRGQLAASEERGREAARLSGALGAVETENKRLEAALQASQADAREQEKAGHSAQDRALHLQGDVDRLQGEVAQKVSALQQVEANAKEASEQLHQALQQRDEENRELSQQLRTACNGAAELKGQVRPPVCHPCVSWCPPPPPALSYSSAVTNSGRLECPLENGTRRLSSVTASDRDHRRKHRNSRLAKTRTQCCLLGNNGWKCLWRGCPVQLTALLNAPPPRPPPRGGGGSLKGGSLKGGLVPSSTPGVHCQVLCAAFS